MRRALCGGVLLLTLGCRHTPYAVPTPRAGTQGWVALTSTGCSGTTTKGLTVVSDNEWWIPCRANGVRHTTDGGLTYQSVTSGLPATIDATHVDLTSHGVMLTALGNQAAGGGIYKLVNSAWVRGNTHTPVGIAEMPNGDLLLVSMAASGRPRAYRDTGGDLNFVAISGDIFAGIGGAGGVDVDPATHRLRISSEGSGVFGSDDEGKTWVQDGPNSGGTTNGPGFGHTSANKVLYFAQDKIFRWLLPNVWEIVAHPSGQEGWKYVDTVNSFCWSIADDGALYIGGDHVQYGIYKVTNNESLYTPFMELTPGPPKGTRIYGVAVLHDSQKLLVVVRDASVWLSNLPVAPPPSGGSSPPSAPAPVRAVLPG